MELLYTLLISHALIAQNLLFESVLNKYTIEDYHNHKYALELLDQAGIDYKNTF